jgi:PPK2 family polyphosphate:nucleotide phosphotransferase
MEYRKQFIVEPGSRVKLDNIDPGFKDRHENKESTATEIEHYRQRLFDLQYRLYAERKRSLLIVLQALDAGGKDGVIRHVMSTVNPQGCRVTCFKKPTDEEAGHDFLWRIHRATPAKGEIAIFNRSHYEDVLVTRVHHLVSREVWSKRYAHIHHFEQLLHDSGVHILKFFLYIGKAEQLARFKERLDDPAKQWKISDADYEERQYWDDYQAAFEDALSECSTTHAPWFVIPANHKWFRDLAVSQIIVETLEGLKMELPEPTVNLHQIRQKYHAAAAEGKKASDANVSVPRTPSDVDIP